MYGMIHRAAREMVLEQHGAGAWSEVVRLADLHEAHFISASTYSDDLTQSLLAAVASVLQEPEPSLLATFGRYWIKYVLKGPYGDILRLAGDDLATILTNLDRLHDAIRVAMPAADTPSFEVLRRQSSEIRLAYRSNRAGLEPFVIGLLQGLMEECGLVPQLVTWTPLAQGAEFVLTAPQGRTF
ncbi:heme NO-binding domain-containing protein [Phenylobacterium conjunctum]|uniref:Heme NO-binding domain-containing protein n=1 Tax=Phenylobacterium conjunctum TaxID=1298959 RepID=A0ABW3T8M6_9CAUL